MKDVQQTHFQKSSGKSKEVEALIGSLTDQEDKHESPKHFRTINDIKLGDMVRLKTGIFFKYGLECDILNNRSVGKFVRFNSRDDIYVEFPKYGEYLYVHCTLDEIEFAT